MLINTDQLRKQLAKAQERLTRFPDGPLEMEPVARCLHWLNDPAATDMFLRLADACGRAKNIGRSPTKLMEQGNYLRLAREPEQALTCFAKARTLLEPRARAGDDIGVAELIECCFLLDDYPEVIRLAEQLRSLTPDTDLRAFAVARLASARVNRRNDEAAQVAEEFAKFIVEEDAELSDTSAALSLWDWYELALAPVE